MNEQKIIEFFSLVKHRASALSRSLGDRVINILSLSKQDSEFFVFLYDDASRKQAIATLGRFARHEECPDLKDLNFQWYDAAILSQKIRQESERL